MNSPAQSPRGPHPLSQLLALAMRVTGGDRVAMAAFLDGLDRYQRAPMPAPMPPLAIVDRSGGVMLRRLSVAPAGGPTPALPAVPAVVIVPSLINPPSVLDLAEGRSLLRHLGAAGHDVHLVDWGDGMGSERRLGLAGMVAVRLLPLLRRMRRPVLLVGYCLGGTLALATAQLLGPQCRGLALLAAPWHVAGYGAVARHQAVATWAALRPVAMRLGVVPISMLNPLFWSLDERGVVSKYQRLAATPAGDPRLGWFAAVEDWANGGAPLSLPAARDLFEHGFGRDRIGSGRWRVSGVAIQPEQLACPVLDVGATGDRIVPQATRLRGDRVERLDIAAGHVGMVIGSEAPVRLWEPLSNWLQAR